MPFLVLYILGLLLLLQNLTVITFCKMWNIRQKVILRKLTSFQSIFYWSEPCCCLRCKLFSICKPTNTWNIKTTTTTTSQVAVVTHRILASLIQRRMKAPWMQKKNLQTQIKPSFEHLAKTEANILAKMYYLTNTVKCLVKFTIYMQNEQKSLAYLLSIYENMLT